MSRLLNGWMITEADGEKLFYKIMNGSPYQVDVTEPTELMELPPGYYDESLNPFGKLEKVTDDHGHDHDARGRFAPKGEDGGEEIKNFLKMVAQSQGARGGPETFTLEHGKSF